MFLESKIFEDFVNYFLFYYNMLMYTVVFDINT